MLLLAAAVVGGLIYLRRAGAPNGLELQVRCRAGHVFRTVWPWFVADKARRMGGWRLQYCPIGRHWTFVAPVDPSELDRADG